MMKFGKSGQKLRVLVIEALASNIMFGGKDPSELTLGKIMGIMEIEDEEIRTAQKKEVS